MRRLIRITHDRCHEYSDTSYMAADEALSAEQIVTFCNAARDACLEAERQEKKEAPPYPQEPSVRRVPAATTAGELIAHYEQQKAAYDKWQKEQNATKRTFESRLEEVSGGKICSLYKATENDEELEVSWGHNHGLRLRYGTERNWKDDAEECKK